METITDFITESRAPAASIGLVLTGFLLWWEKTRKLLLGFIGDVLGLIGLRSRIRYFRELDRDRQLEESKKLLANEDLDDAQKKRIDAIRKGLIDRAIEELEKASSHTSGVVTDRAEHDQRDAVEQTAISDDPEEHHAHELISEGKKDAAFEILASLSERDTMAATDRWRRLGHLVFQTDTTRAVQAFEKIIALGTSDPWDYIYLGRLYVQAGSLSAAREVFKAALPLLEETQNTRNRSVVMLELGDIAVALGDLDEAKRHFEATHKIRKQRCEEAPEEADRQRDLSVSLNKVGEVQSAQGDLTAALDSFHAAMEIRDRLTKADPGNAGWQRDLSVSHEKIGDVQLAQGDLTAALGSFRASMEISDRLAKADPGNADWQRDLSVSLNKIGDVQSDQGDLTAALDSFHAAMEISDRLAKADPGNAGWQRDLSVSLNKVGDVQAVQGDLTAALDSFHAAMEISDCLAKADPGNAGWQRDLSVSLNKIGDVQSAQADLTAALDSFRASMEIRDRLAKADPGNAGWQADLAACHGKIGKVMARQGDNAGALEDFEIGRAIVAPLAARSGHTRWQGYVDFFDEAIAALED